MINPKMKLILRNNISLNILDLNEYLGNAAIKIKTIVNDSAILKKTFIAVEPIKLIASIQLVSSLSRHGASEID